MNPYAILAVVALWGGSIWYAIGIGQDMEIATQAREDKAAGIARRAANTAAAKAISEIEVKHVTIRQRADTVIRENSVYRDCVHDQRMLNDINAARGHEPAGGGVVPPASAPR